MSHCDMLTETAEAAVAGAIDGDSGGAYYGVPNPSSKPRVALKKRNAAAGKRTHHRSKVSCMLPSYDGVDMTFGTTPWWPTVLLRGANSNVFMEVTAANLQTLFNIVQAQVADPNALTDSVPMPPKKGKRPKGHPLAPIDSPRGRKYHVANKGGWIRRVKGDAGGSRSSTSTGRKYRRVSTESQVTAEEKGRNAEQVLGEDDDCISCHSRGVSPSEESPQ